MKEAEKEAERIIEMFKPYAEGKAGFALEKEQAKQCALLHVNGIIKEVNKYNHTDLADIQGWQEVLTILKNK